MTKDILVLGIETSCDETACSVVKNGRVVLSNVVSSQIDIHKKYGGVVPEIASRNHLADIEPVTKKALADAGVTMKDMDAVAVTYGAGLLGALLVGVSFAKSLALAHKLPLIKVNHIEGHICSNYLTYTGLTPPFVCLLASGGHTAVALVKDYTEYEVLNTTVDDACGEAFDKVARRLGLDYPGGEKLDKLASRHVFANERSERGNPEKQSGETIPVFKTAVMSNGNFSYSGLKTAVLNYLNGQEQKGLPICKEDVSKSFHAAALDGLIEQTIKTAKRIGMNKICIAGGVGANSYLREKAVQMAKEEGLKLFLPELKYCGDNAAMIASRSYFSFVKGQDIAGMDLNAEPTLKLK